MSLCHVESTNHESKVYQIRFLLLPIKVPTWGGRNSSYGRILTLEPACKFETKKVKMAEKHTQQKLLHFQSVLI
jgi:hypothetical protein